MSSDTNWHSAGCGNMDCDAFLMCEDYSTAASAIAAWNTRAKPPYINDLIAWVENSPHKGFCSRYNSKNSELKCGCGRDEMLEKAKNL